MSEVLKQPAVLGAPEVNLKGARLSSYLPAAIALCGAVALMLLRIKVGPAGIVRSDSGLMLCALAAYLIAAVF